MTFDIEILNGRNVSMFLSGAKSMVLVAKGSATIEVGDTSVYIDTGITVGAERDIPLILLDNLNGLKTYSSTVVRRVSTNTWAFYIRRSYNNRSSELSANWFIYDTNGTLPAPTGYGININNPDGSINWSSEITFLRPISCGAVRRQDFPKGIAYDDEMPAKYLELRHVYDRKLDYTTAGEFTHLATTDYVVRFNGNSTNPNFELDSFYQGSFGNNDGGAGGTDETINFYGTYIPVMLFHHPDNA